MSEYYDFFSEGDWDDRGEIGWSERTWRQYLRHHQAEISRFQDIYSSLQDKPNHIDEVAHLMGWENDDWTATDFDLGDDNDTEDDSPEDDIEPYTLHRHPVYIFTRGLYLQISRQWESALTEATHSLKPRQVWDFSRSLHEGEMHAVMALQAQDLGDFALTVCHMKHALTAINDSLKHLQNFSEAARQSLSPFHTEAMIRLFDLREVWIRVMSDCRQEMRQRPDGD